MNLKSLVFKVLMLSATPVNNRFNDLKNQLAIAYEGKPEIINSKLNLGLNEFRLDLLEYLKSHDGFEKKPKGLHAVVPATDENPEGVVFVLKNINNSVNIDNQNRIPRLQSHMK